MEIHGYLISSHIGLSLVNFYLLNLLSIKLSMKLSHWEHGYNKNSRFSASLIYQ